MSKENWRGFKKAERDNIDNGQRMAIAKEWKMNSEDWKKRERKISCVLIRRQVDFDWSFMNKLFRAMTTNRFWNELAWLGSAENETIFFIGGVLATTDSYCFCKVLVLFCWKFHNRPNVFIEWGLQFNWLNNHVCCSKKLGQRRRGVKFSKVCIKLSTSKLFLKSSAIYNKLVDLVSTRIGNKR